MVAGTNRPEDIDPSGVRKLLHLLDALRDSPAGSIIYRQVEAMLDGGAGQGVQGLAIGGCDDAHRPASTRNAGSSKPSDRMTKNSPVPAGCTSRPSAPQPG